MEYINEEYSLKSGVYKITNKINGRIYIGSAKEFKRRYNQHRIGLIKKKHSNKFLQADFDKCGEDAFVFEVIEVVEGPQENRLLVEQTYIKIITMTKINAITYRHTLIKEVRNAGHIIQKKH